MDKQPNNYSYLCNDGEPPVNASSQKSAKSKFSWKAANLLIGFLLFFNPVAFLLQITVFGISIQLVGVLIAVNLVLFICYRFFKSNPKGKLLVSCLRTLAILCTIIFLAVPSINMFFNEVKWMYPVKKYVYANGVSSRERCEQILPKLLPSDCEDYVMITQGSMVAQDYHPSLYLMFHTDEETMRKYELHMESLAETKRHESTPPDPYDPEYIYYTDPDPFYDSVRCPKEFPMHVYSRVRRAGFTDSLDYAVIYEIPDYYNKGCMLNYETGLVVFWI